jgi:hypothetical protein
MDGDLEQRLNKIVAKMAGELAKEFPDKIDAPTAVDLLKEAIRPSLTIPRPKGSSEGTRKCPNCGFIAGG